MEYLRLFNWLLILAFGRLCCGWVRIIAPSPRVAILGGPPVELECSYKPDNAKEIILGLYWYRRSSHEKKFLLVAQIPNKDYVELPPTFTDLNLKKKSKLNSYVNGSYTVTTLTISKVDCLDEGVYQCEVQVYGVKQPFKAKIELKIHEEPSMPTLKQTPELVVENGRVTFTCTGALGKPRAVISWQIFRHAGNELKQVMMAGVTSVQSSAISCSPLGVSQLEVVATKDDVRIVCVIEQFTDSGVKLVRRIEQLTLGVQYSVRATEIAVHVNSRKRRTKTILVTEGDLVNLTCKGQGNPPPLYTWRYSKLDNQVTVSTMAPLLELSQWVFSLGNITANQSGLYTCTAENQIHDEVHTETKSVQIIVQERLHLEFNNDIDRNDTGGEDKGRIAMYIMIGGIMIGASLFVVVTSLLAAQCYKTYTHKQIPVRYQGVRT